MTSTTLESPKSNRRKLYKLHSWVGFHLAFIMSIVLATGTIATVSNEIDWLIQKELRVTPGTEKVSWQIMTDAVQAYAPDSSILSLSALNDDYLAYRASVKDQHGKRYFIHVNQWTGDITGTTGLITVQRVVRDLHRYLFMPNVIGLPIVGSMAIILLISLYSGFKTARNWKTLMTRVRVNKGARVMIGDAHKAVGLWSIWLILLTSITGTWYLAEFASEITAYVKENPELAFEPSGPSLSAERLHDMGAVIKSRTTSDIISATEAALPEIKGNITTIFFPFKANNPISVLGTRNNPILRDRANRVFLDPESLEPIKVQRSEDISLVAWLNEVADPLHFGSWGGLITKLIWFAFGLGLTSLSISGVYLTWKRLKTKAVSRTQFATLPVLFLALLAAYFYWYPIYKVPTKSYGEIELDQKSHESFLMQAYLGVTNKMQADGSFRFVIKAGEARPNIKEVRIQLKQDQQLLGESKKLKLKYYSNTSLYQSKLSKDHLLIANEMLATVVLYTGESIVTRWPISL